MKRLYTWLLSCKRWLVLVACAPLLVFTVWLLVAFRTAALVFFVVIWFSHLSLGIGAGWAAVRLWYFRHHPLMKWVGVYITAFIVDVLSAIVLLFVARGVKFTWKFSAVMFVSALICNILRAPLIVYLIRGPSAITPLSVPEKPPDFLEAVRRIIREENARSRRATKASLSSRRKPPRK